MGSHIVDPSEIMSESAIREDAIITRKIIFSSSLEGIKWCVRRKLLRNNLDCEDCNIPMTFIRYSRNVTDGYQWGCKRCRHTRSLRKGSLFEGSHLTLSQILIIMYGWANDCPQEYVAREAELSANSSTVSDWYNLCQEVSKNYFIRNKIGVGGINEDGTSKMGANDESKFLQFPRHQILEELLITIAQQYPGA